jgi:hypothetical protein
MIIIEFYGGLGNQMLQYSFYKKMQKVYGSSFVKADINNYRFYKHHYGFELEKVFGIHMNYASKWELLHFPNIKTNNVVTRLIKRYLSAKSHYFRLENFLEYCPEVFTLNASQFYYLSGCWGAEEYCIDVMQRCKEDFKFSDSIQSETLDAIRSTESVSIHVRRGDFVNTEYDVLSIQYYKRAIDYLYDCYADLQFYLFSNDAAYVEQNFAFLKNKVIVKENADDNSYKDMYYMSCCKHNIIANSTFSYWGAVLNKNANKIMIAPKRYHNNPMYKGMPLTQKGWILLDV